MIFAASDVESLSKELSRWEWFEYISEAFVIVACVGELVADLEASWLTEQRKKHIQRRSTILLVAALSASLICLFQTNELSGNVIGSLGGKAEAANRKAGEAKTSAEQAKTIAAAATNSARDATVKASDANDISEKAKTAASDALLRVTYLRNEEEHLRADVDKGKKEQLVLNRSLWAFARRVGDRTFDIGSLIDSLKGKRKRFVEIRYMPNDMEAKQFAGDIHSGFDAAGWESSVSELTDDESGPYKSGNGAGLEFWFRENANDYESEEQQLMRALTHAVTFGTVAQLNGGVQSIPDDRMVVWVTKAIRN